MIYTGITRAWFTAIEANAVKETGIAISGDEGTAEGETLLGKVTVQWVYSEAEQTLTVGDTKKPWDLPEREIEKKLTALVVASQPGTPQPETVTVI